MPAKKFKILDSQKIIDHPFLQVDQQTIQLPDGRIIPDWHWVHTRDYINVVVCNENNETLILEGYKHGFGRSSWQVVGGYMETGENPLHTAQRELLEETGFASDDWTQLGSFVVDANRHVGTAHFFLAKSARQIAQPDHDDLEDFVLRWVSLEALQQALREGRVAGLGYAGAISMALLHLHTQDQ
jgi:ADP-ribose pyrophosphatase